MDRPSTPPTNPEQVIEAVRNLTEKIKQANERRRKPRAVPPARTPPYGLPVLRPATR